MQYAAAPQHAHQDFGGRGCQGGYNNYRGREGRGTQRRGNCCSGRSGQGNSDLTHYCWTHRMCAHTIKYCRMPAEGHKKDTVWCNKMLVSKQNCIWQVGSIPASKHNAKETKTSYTSELLCSSIVEPPQHATIIAKSDSGGSNNYWRTEDILVLTNIKDTHNVPEVQLPNNANMNTKNTGILPLSRSLSTQAKRHTCLMDYTVHLSDDDCSAILDKKEINIIKNKKLILKGNRNMTAWLCYIPISRPLRHCAHTIITRDKTKIELIQYFHGCWSIPTQRTFLTAIKMGTSLHGQASTINNC